METIKEIQKRGDKYVGRYCQSTVLTMIGQNGNKVFAPQQEITGYEIAKSHGENTLMLFLGGESVFEDTCFNFSKP